MEFQIGASFSYEITDYSVCLSFSNKLSNHFNNKSYGEIQQIYCGVICVSEQFAPFFMPRPLKILRKEPAIEFEYVLDFELFKSASQDKREEYIAQEFLKTLEDISNNIQLKKLDLPALVSDIQLFIRRTYLIE